MFMYYSPAVCECSLLMLTDSCTVYGKLVGTWRYNRSTTEKKTKEKVGNLPAAHQRSGGGSANAAATSAPTRQRVNENR